MTLTRAAISAEIRDVYEGHDTVAFVRRSPARREMAAQDAAMPQDAAGSKDTLAEVRAFDAGPRKDRDGCARRDDNDPLSKGVLKRVGLRFGRRGYAATSTSTNGPLV